MTTSRHKEWAEASTAGNDVLEVGGRLGQGPSDLLIRTAFQQELDGQAGLFQSINTVDLAHTLVMTETGTVPHAIGRSLLEALHILGTWPDDFSLDAGRGDLYTNREAWLKDHGYPYDWLGAGRARREAITTAFLMTVREKLLTLMNAMIGTGRSLIDQAEAHADALMPDYTYLQAAQPTTFGHYLSGFVFPLFRDLDRLKTLYARVNRSPAGCGSTNGSRLRQDRETLSRLMGFDGLVSHGRDAMWQADLPIECGALLTNSLINLDRLAEDLQIFSTEEFGLIEFDDRHARASKIMPNKKNPFALTHVRGQANAMIGTLTTLAALARTSTGQPDNRLNIYGLLPKAIDDTVQVVKLMGEIVENVRLNRDTGRSRLDHGFVMATELAEALVEKCGLSFRDAHRLVGHWVRENRSGRGLAELTSIALSEAAFAMLGSGLDLAQDDLAEILKPENAIAIRTEIGGAAPEAMAAMIDHCRSELNRAEAWRRVAEDRLLTAQTSLLRVVDEFLAGSGKDASTLPGTGSE